MTRAQWAALTTTTPTDADTADGLEQCWCCDHRDANARLVHLGNHAEVALCLGCAHWLSRSASGIEDRDKTGAVVAARDALRHVRAVVVGHRWHQTPIVGAAIRWIGRHLP